jgi:hypothetical protein
MNNKNGYGGKMKHRVLWIEDGAFVEVSSFTGPVFAQMIYDLDVAVNVSDALKQIREDNPYDAVIVDIRILPGSDSKWESFYRQTGSNKINARLGIQLLFSLLKPGKPGMESIQLKNIPSWVSPGKFGVFSVESEQDVQNDLEELGINSYRQKKTGLPNTTLLELIEEMIGISGKDSKAGGNQ